MDSSDAHPCRSSTLLSPCSGQFLLAATPRLAVASAIPIALCDALHMEYESLSSQTHGYA